MTETIITLTDEAKAHIQKFLAPMEATAGFRIAVKKMGCSGYAYLVDVVEAPKEGDIVQDQDDIKLFIAPDAIEIVKGTTIDYQAKEANQKQLVFQNPNAEDYCGCGESFTIK